VKMEELRIEIDICKADDMNLDLSSLTDSFDKLKQKYEE